MSVYLPMIGITADVAAHPEEMGERAMARCNYADAIRRAGALSVILPYDVDCAADYIARIDGLVVTGGRFDLPPAWYGGQPAQAGTIIKEDRSRAERALIEAALDCDLPILGVCNGMQLLGVMHGAPVIEHIPHEIPGALDHMAAHTPHEAQHDIVFAPDATLGTVAGQSTARVNSVHHQALLPGENLIAAAVAPDGVIEAIEVPGRRFCFGLQWHPEYEVSPADTAIFKAFVTAAVSYREQIAMMATA